MQPVDLCQLVFLLFTVCPMHLDKDTLFLLISAERCHSGVVRAIQLLCRKSVESREIKPGLAIGQLENSLCQPSNKRVPFLNRGRIRQDKERDGLCFHLLCPDAVDV